MRIFKIGPLRYLENFDGLGASYKDGARWNEQGHPVMYFGLSPSVAMLEMANYFPLPKFIPKDYRLGIYEIPGNLVDTFDKANLPVDWDLFPHPMSTRAIGSSWLTSKANVGLVLPSSATPGGLENIMLINPLVKGSEKINLVDSQSKLFNERAFVGL